MAGKHDVEIAQANYQLKSHQTDSRCGAFRTFCRCLLGIGVALFVYLSVKSIAGTTTTFSAMLFGLAKIGADRWVAYACGGLGVTGYFVERRNKRRAVNGMSSELNELRDIVDNKRLHSGLGPHGNPSKDELADD